MFTHMIIARTEQARVYQLEASAKRAAYEATIHKEESAVHLKSSKSVDQDGGGDVFFTQDACDAFLI